MFGFGKKYFKSVTAQRKYDFQSKVAKTIIRVSEKLEKAIDKLENTFYFAKRKKIYIKLF